MTLSQGDKFPSGVEFKYVPIELETLNQDDGLACGKPLPLGLDSLFEKNLGGNVLFVAVPGAFTPTCTENHIPPILEHLKELKAKKKITTAVFLSANDPFVINAWGKLLLKQQKVSASSDLPKIIFASDPNAAFSLKNGISLDLTDAGLGVRTNRYALVVNGDSKTISYVGVESEPGVTVSGYDGISSAKL